MPSRNLLLAAAIFWLIPAALSAADETYSLQERVSPARLVKTEIHVDVTGTAEFAIGKGKSVSHPITAEASLEYRERRLPGAGRDAEAVALRHYDSSQAQIRVGGHITSPRLRDDRRLIVARGRREGNFFYSPRGTLTASELELLHAPGDSLCLVALLPPKPVALGEKWTPPSWVVQMLTDTEAASTAELSCALASVDEGQAKITFEGTVEGATACSSGSVKIRGRCFFDRKEERITRAEIDLTETRTVGPVSPGMTVSAKAVVVRTPTDNASSLSEQDAADVPLDPPPALTLLHFRAPWNVELNHAREWHVFQQTAEVAVLRLIEKGTFVAQCNLAPVKHAGAGEHVSEQQFQNDIRASLGKRLKAIEKAERIESETDRFVYRVIAVGESNNGPLTWIYYLCAAPDGSQVSCVFSIDASLRSRFGDRDLTIIKSLRFLDVPKAPEKRGPPGRSGLECKGEREA